MSNTIRIECPKCEWQPDGNVYWKCSCGHAWNTFETKAKCPACSKQWETTWCPGCGSSTVHEDWYVDVSLPAREYAPAELELRKKKMRFESRLIGLGITTYRVSDLDYLDHSKETFQTPYDAGCRLLILYGIAYAVHSLDERLSLVEWFKRENIWDKVSEKEQAFLFGNEPEQELLIDLSWAIEGALALGWALGIIDRLPEIDQQDTQEALDDFTSKIPSLGDTTATFFKDLSYRPLEEIYEENLVNEAATSYFRDIFLSGKEDETSINRMVSFERHRVLNWLRQFAGVKDWDEIGTDT